MHTIRKLMTVLLCAAQCMGVGLASAEQAKPGAAAVPTAGVPPAGQKPATVGGVAGGMPGTSGMTNSGPTAIALMPAPSKLLASDAAMNLAQTGVELKASLYSSSSATLAARPIVFKVEGKIVGTMQTGADGRATFNYTPPAAPAAGSHTWTASFDGDNNYKSATANATLIVNKEASKLVIDSTNVTWDQVAFTHHVHFSGTLTGYADHGPIKVGDGISASIDGKKIENLKTDAQGRFEGEALSVPSGSRTLQIEFQGSTKYATSMDGKTFSVPPAKLYFWFPEGVGVLHDHSSYGLGDLQQPAKWIWMDCDYNKTSDAGTFMVTGYPTTVKVHVTKDNTSSGRPAGAVNVSLNFAGAGKTDANGDAVLTYTLPTSGTGSVQLKAEPADSTQFAGSGVSAKYLYPPITPPDTCVGGSSHRQRLMPVH